MKNVLAGPDVVIIGAGAAGLAAAQYAARLGLGVLVIEERCEGGQAAFIDRLENYPGLAEPVSGLDFAQNMKRQAEGFGAAFLRGKVVGIEKADQRFALSLEAESAEGEAKALQAKAVILATGAERRKLGAAGEDELFGRGVSYCAACDGPFFRGKRVAVVGGGDAACDEAECLSRIAESVVMIHRRDAFRAQKALAQRVLANPAIRTVFNSTVEEIRGGQNGAVSSIILKDAKTGELSQLECAAVFVSVGMAPSSGLAAAVRPKALERDESGYIIADERMETSCAGIFAAGDVRKKPFRQVITAAADGAVAAHSAAEYIAALKA